jgi:hypothetical protein
MYSYTIQIARPDNIGTVFLPDTWILAATDDFDAQCKVEAALRNLTDCGLLPHDTRYICKRDPS